MGSMVRGARLGTGQTRSRVWGSAHARSSARASSPRRTARSILFALLAVGANNVWAFGFADVAQRAETLAQAAYQKPGDDIPKVLKDLTYDQYKDIRFRPDHAYWRGTGLPFELGFFHLGFQYREPVKINEVTSAGVRPIHFDPSLFDYGKNRLDPSQFGDLGYAGFRVHYAINDPKYKDEVLAFLGASYFRALGKGQVYGLSARGLAIDTGEPSGEEFPRFVEFWIERPGLKARDLKFYALLDSPRATGAFRFVLQPGRETVMEIKARFYTRAAVRKLGIAPLTSMFFFGENQHPTVDDYRPEVHDSDGLSVHLGTGEWLWRPLVNPKRLLVTSFAAVDPAGFGLMQRDRDFDHYQDIESRFDLRPSVWVEPKGKWGAGRVELVEIPTPDETNDNIVAYWVPDKLPPPKQPLELEYRLHWQMESETKPPQSWIVQTRRGRAYVRHPDGSIAFTIEFDGPRLRTLPPDAKLVNVASVDANGEIVENTLYRNEVTGTWRAIVRVLRKEANKPVELRAYLRDTNNGALSETWSYILPPE